MDALTERSWRVKKLPITGLRVLGALDVWNSSADIREPLCEGIMTLGTQRNIDKTKQGWKNLPNKYKSLPV